MKKFTDAHEVVRAINKLMRQQDAIWRGEGAYRHLAPSEQKAKSLAIDKKIEKLNHEFKRLDTFGKRDASQPYVWATNKNGLVLAHGESAKAVAKLGQKQGVRLLSSAYVQDRPPVGIRRDASKRDASRVPWRGLEYNERQATLWHNRLAYIILDGIDDRGRENLKEANTKLAELLDQKVPGNQRNMVARRWEQRKTSLRRMWHEAQEVGQGKRAAKLGKKSERDTSPRCSSGTEVQSLILNNQVFDRRDAIGWAKRHGFKATKVDVTENTFRLRQMEPGAFQANSFRTIVLRPGVKAVVACPKG